MGALLSSVAAILGLVAVLPAHGHGLVRAAVDGRIPVDVGARFGAFALGATLVQLHEARSLVAAERERTTRELEAVDAFRRRVEAADPTARAPAGGQSGGVLVRADDGGDTAGEVRDAYRETVMAVADGTGDESFVEHFNAEFGPDVASAVLGADRFTPQVKQRLLGVMDERRDKRETLLAVLDREAGELREFDDTLEDVDSALETVCGDDCGEQQVDAFPDWSYGRLQHEWFRLDELDGRLRAALRDRQRYRQSASGNGVRTADFSYVLEYVYGTLDTDYPCLQAGLRMQATVAEARRRLTDALSRRI